METGKEHFPALDRGGYRRHALAVYAAEIRDKLLQDKGITLARLRDWIEATLGVTVNVKLIH